MNDILNYFIIAIVVCYLIVAIVRIVLNRKLVKETKVYEKEVEEKMMSLQKDIQSRTKDLQESMQMINQEYSKMMKDMGDQQKEDMSRVVTALKKRKAQPKKPSTAGPSQSASEKSPKNPGVGPNKGTSKPSSAQPKKPPTQPKKPLSDPNDSK